MPEKQMTINGDCCPSNLTKKHGNNSTSNQIITPWMQENRQTTRNLGQSPTWVRPAP